MFCSIVLYCALFYPILNLVSIVHLTTLLSLIFDIVSLPEHTLIKSIDDDSINDNDNDNDGDSYVLYGGRWMMLVNVLYLYRSLLISIIVLWVTTSLIFRPLLYVRFCTVRVHRVVLLLDASKTSSI